MATRDTFYPRVFGSVTAIVLGFAMLRILRPFLGPILWAGLLAFLAFPLNDRLRRLFRGRRTAAATLLTVVAILVIVVPTVALVGVFVRQTSDLVASLQAAATQYRIQQPSDVLHLPVVDGLIRRVGSWLPVTSQQVQTWAVEGGQQILQALVGVAGSLFASALSAAVAIVLALFLFFFLLRDGEQMVARTVALVPLDDGRKDRLLTRLSAVLKAVVLGSLIVALVQGTLVGVGFALVGLPSPLVFAVLAVGAALIPLIGTTVVWVPAALWLTIGGRWGAGLFLAFWGVGVVSSADNVIRPLFISSRAQITTLPVFIGLVGGISAFGPIGVFLGPVLVALVLALIEFAEEAKAEAPATGPEAP